MSRTRNLSPNNPIPVVATSPQAKVLPGETKTKARNNIVPSPKKGGAEEEIINENRTISLPVGWGEELSLYQSSWVELFQQFPEMLRKISQGILIAFSDGAPSLLHRPLELRSNNRPSDLLQAVKKLLDSQAIEEVMDTSSPGYYSRLFLVPKPDGSFRPIIDLKKLNLFVDIPSFKKKLFSPS